jgi:hypothetical protein
VTRKYTGSSIKYFSWINENLYIDDIDNRCVERDLKEQGVRAVHKLVDDPDPAWIPDLDKSNKRGGRNCKDYTRKTTIPEDYR